MAASRPRHLHRTSASTRGRGDGTVANFPFPVSIALLLLLFVSLVCSAEAQPPSANSPGSNGPAFNGRFSPSMAVIIVVLISAFFFMGFFSIYIRQCSERADPSTRTAVGGGARSRRAAARGLDPAVIQTFPTLVYADVKEHKIGKGALECAVCLSEFEDEDTLRLLPKCDHVFHPDCIDAWLSAHTTCPVCRANLTPDANAPAAAAAAVAVAVAPTAPSAGEANAGTLAATGLDVADGDELQRERATDSAVEAASQPDHVAITIEQESSAVPPATDRMARMESRSRLPWRSKSSARPPRFPRSHSTGHSIAVVQPGEDCERYTLRLPEHIRRDIMAGKLQRSSSCAAYPTAGEGSTRKGYRQGGAGEGSSRGVGGGSIGGRSFKLRRWDWVAKSDRWASFARNFSMKLSRGDAAAEGSTRKGEGSTRKGVEEGDAAGDGSIKAKAFPAVRSPFDCLSGGGGGGDAAVDEDGASTKGAGSARV